MPSLRSSSRSARSVSDYGSPALIGAGMGLAIGASRVYIPGITDRDRTGRQWLRDATALPPQWQEERHGSIPSFVQLPSGIAPPGQDGGALAASQGLGIAPGNGALREGRYDQGRLFPPPRGDLPGRRSRFRRHDRGRHGRPGQRRRRLFGIRRSNLPEQEPSCRLPAGLRLWT